MLVRLHNFYNFISDSKTGRSNRYLTKLVIGGGLAGLSFALLQGLAMAAEAVAEGGAAEEEMKGLPQFEVSTFPSQLFWLVISFGVFFFLMRRFFVPSIGGKLEMRDKIIKNNYQSAEKMLAQSKQMEEKLEEKLSIARANARTEIAKVASMIAESQEKSLKKFQQHADGILNESNNNLQKIKNAIYQEKPKMVDNLGKEIVKNILL